MEQKSISYAIEYLEPRSYVLSFEHRPSPSFPVVATTTGIPFNGFRTTSKEVAQNIVDYLDFKGLYARVVAIETVQRTINE
jgi:hypothetical protein